MWTVVCVAVWAIGFASGHIWCGTKLRRLRLVRERVVEFATRCTLECEMTLRDDDAARAIEGVGRHLLEVVELAEQGE